MSFLMTEWRPSSWSVHHYYGALEPDGFDVPPPKQRDEEEEVDKMRGKIDDIIRQRHNQKKLSPQYVKPLQGYGGHFPAQPLQQEIGTTVANTENNLAFRRMKTIMYEKPPTFGHRGPLSTQVTGSYPYNPYNRIEKFYTPHAGSNNWNY